jgi:hypothetical protein
MKFRRHHLVAPTGHTRWVAIERLAYPLHITVLLAAQRSI